MMRTSSRLACLLGSGTASTTGGSTATGGATGTPGCDRPGLEAAVNSYLAALQAGDPSSMPLAASVAHEENMASVAIEQGLFAAPITIADVEGRGPCRTTRRGALPFSMTSLSWSRKRHQTGARRRKGGTAKPHLITRVSLDLSVDEDRVRHDCCP